jgi:hypothetical protein
MRTEQEIQDKIYELYTKQNKKNKNYLQFQIDILNWTLEKSDVQSICTVDLQKEGINIEFG